MINDMLQDTGEIFARASYITNTLAQYDYERDDRQVYKQLAEQLIAFGFAAGFIMNLVEAEDEYQEENES